MRKCRKLDHHHRLPQKQGGTDSYPTGNLILVSRNRHQHWSALFAGNRTLESIVDELNRVWIDPRYRLEIKEKTDGP